MMKCSDQVAIYGRTILRHAKDTLSSVPQPQEALTKIRQACFQCVHISTPFSSPFPCGVARFYIVIKRMLTLSSPRHLYLTKPYFSGWQIFIISRGFAHGAWTPVPPGWMQAMLSHAITWLISVPPHFPRLTYTFATFMNERSDNKSRFESLDTLKEAIHHSAPLFRAGKMTPAADMYNRIKILADKLKAELDLVPRPFPVLFIRYYVDASVEYVLPLDQVTLPEFRRRQMQGKEI